MKRIMIEWNYPREGQEDLHGLVCVDESEGKAPLADGPRWRVSVAGQGSNLTIKQELIPGGERYLPESHAKYSQEVEKLAKAYYYGFRGFSEVFTWVE